MLLLESDPQSRKEEGQGALLVFCLLQKKVKAFPEGFQKTSQMHPLVGLCQAPLALLASVETGEGGGGWERQRRRDGDSQHLSLEQLISAEMVTLLRRAFPILFLPPSSLSNINGLS